MTHLQANGDAYLNRDDRIQQRSTTRVCMECEKEFQRRRFWQRQCSPRCRQRAYVRLKEETPVGYYGA